MVERYFSHGSMSLKEGLTFHKDTYDDNGNVIVGSENPLENLFMCKEISKQQYDAYMQMLRDPAVPKGLAGGILNEKGLEDLKNYSLQKKNEFEEKVNAKINFSVKKIKKQLQLGIIDESDIDDEIKQQNMSNFAEEIKRRLVE